ncbi:MAG: Indole-3-glycerol phosphate synthase [Bacteroidetes bacterium]|nr:MAG: Indole-3-glycerol phosphate synthase [Bacteroidota bacterium]
MHHDMTILEEIIAHKKNELEERRSLYPVKLLERSVFFETKPVSLRHYLGREDLGGIIAEFKRRSPSKGMINEYASVEKTTIGYMQAGAAALSVLTDTRFFGGASRDLEIARKFNYCPILRKDFIIDEYQVIETKSIGADVVLLIAEVLTAAEINKLAALAASLGLEVLLELHNEDQLDKISPDVHLLGINNRDLHSFQVNFERSIEIAQKIPPALVKIAESGIDSPAAIEKLRQNGFSGFLIGESFMKTANPGKTCARFASSIQKSNSKKAGV